MIKRIIFFVKFKICSLFLTSVSFRSRVEFSSVSRKAKIWRHSVLYYSNVGDYSYIGPSTRVIHSCVGKFCSIAGNCTIGMGTHSLDYLATSSLFTAPSNGTGTKWTNKQCFDEYKTTEIGNDVWIGEKAMIMGGVKIGNGAVVGAGAIVTKNVPPYAIVAGVPARILKYRFSDDVVQKLEDSKWWLLNDEILKQNIHLFQSPLLGDNLNQLLTLCINNSNV